MSNALLASLPRFDEFSDTDAQLSASLPSSPSVAYAPNSALQEDATQVAGSALETCPKSAGALRETDLSNANSDELEEEREALQSTLSELGSALNRLEQESRDQIFRAVETIASTLFPKLAHFFLSDEIAKHLPDLVPIDAPVVEIFAPARIAASLREWAKQSGALPPNCKIITADHPGVGEVSIRWPSGGYDYDFDKLLAVCLAGLSPRHDTIED